MYAFQIINTFSCYQKQHFVCIRLVRPLVFPLPESSVKTAVYRNTAFVPHLFFHFVFCFMYYNRKSVVVGTYVSSLVVKVTLLRTPSLRLVPKKK